jgi:hypothetical protein
MPLLDVSDILMDPDFQDRGLVCERNTSIVSSGGVGSVVAELIPFDAVVTSDKGDVLNRSASGERIVGSIIVHTSLKLIAGTLGFTADIVQWDDRRYTVSDVKNYSRYGHGFVAATCDLLPLSG